MAESSIIREFLVGLGFQVDADSEKKFTDSIDEATKRTEELDKAQVEAGKSALEMAAAFGRTAALVGARTADFASKLEQLHFASRRTGAAASSLKAVANAAQDVGVSADEAQASIESVARYMRSNPSGESFIRSLGVQTRDANGHLRDTADLVADIGREMAKQPTWLAQKRVADLGISENFLLGMRDPEYQKSYDRAKADYLKSGVDSASNGGHAMMTALRHLQSGFEGTVGTYGALGIKTGATLGGGLLTYFAGKEAVQAAVGNALGAGVQEAAKNVATAVAGGAAKAATQSAGATAGKAAIAVAGEAGGVAAGASVTGRVASVLARVLPWVGRALGGIGLLFHSEDLNHGEDEILKRRDERLKRKRPAFTALPEAASAPAAAPRQPPIGRVLSPSAEVQPDAAKSAAAPSLAERIANSAFGRLIQRGESGKAGYRAINIPTVNASGKTTYKAGTADLASMTIDEVLAAQKNRKMFAVGRYQIVSSTLSDAVKALHLSGKEKFDEQTQDRIFGEYLVMKKRPEIADLLLGKSSDLHAALLATSREWASVENPDTGKSYYDGKGGNHASITAKELENALRNSQLALQLSPESMAASQRGRPTHIEVHNDVKINVTGAQNPHETARAVRREQQAVTDRTIRYGGGLTYVFSE
ncbi:glucosaminidase [Burkholderia glumae]|uniref:Glucosaminidase n=1 Tax=Burkholderia glumae TaxID=337 RepID=A0ABY5BAZ5_BURGL|nr:glucosaminidase [Burkholderia glumae]MCM2483373.1 glucosaminidase [Burkholderia glumae]MCM2511275.1 glucosaminidase [Burkholderia glumae]MCM2541150.1 glucosaminidase [Burkholderia glumae]QKM56886.1 hypothetical protein CG017_04953 [Burkholderia glumae]QTP35971.1 hypothetical protein B7759_04606 [Burkholderia glumae]